MQRSDRPTAESSRTTQNAEKGPHGHDVLTRIGEMIEHHLPPSEARPAATGYQSTPYQGQTRADVLDASQRELASLRKTTDDSPLQRKRTLLERTRFEQRTVRLAYLDDQPTRADRLAFAASAQVIADLLTQMRTGMPFILGLDGKWGSGKTSLSLLIEDRLLTQEATATCWVNAWRFETLGQLAEEFLEGIARIVLDSSGRSDQPQESEQEAKELEDAYAQLDGRARQESWLHPGTEHLIEDLVLALYSEKYAALARLIVFVDDLDRCSTHQLDAALKFLRPLARARNVIVVLPCDKARVLETLSALLAERAGGTDVLPVHRETAGQATLAERYLERIVRLWVTMPQPSRVEIASFLADLMGIQAAERPGESEPDAAARDLAHQYLDVIASVVDGNPRSLKGTVSAFNLCRELSQASEANIDFKLRELQLDPARLATLKVFLLRHFWPEQFAAFRLMPEMLLFAQDQARNVQENMAFTVQGDSEVIRWMEDPAFRNLLSLQPLFRKDRVLTANGAFMPPVEQLMATAALCPVALSKAPVVLNQLRANQFANDPTLRAYVQQYAERNLPLVLKQEWKTEIATVKPPVEEAAPAAPSEFAPPAPRAAVNAPPTSIPGGTIRPDARLVDRLQNLELRMTVANRDGDHAELRRLAETLLAILAQIDSENVTDSDDLRNAALVTGNCGVELEKGEMFPEAEQVYQIAIELYPTHAGVHLQYADFLVDRGRLAEADIQMGLARKFDPSHPRIPREEMKIALERMRRGGASVPESVAETLRTNFENDPGSRENAAAYLLFLARSRAPIEEFERACALWASALPPEQKWYAQRSLADRLSNAEVADYARALAIYEDEVLPHVTDRDRRDTLHNAATCAARLKLDDKAQRYWTEAYEMDRTDPTVRASFVQWLERASKFDLALRVSSGQPIGDS